MHRKSNKKSNSYRRKSRRQSQSQSQSQSQHGGSDAGQSHNQIPQSTINEAAKIAQKVIDSMTQQGGSADPAASVGGSVPPLAGLQPASTNGIGAVENAESFTSLNASSIMGGGRRGRGRGRRNKLSQSSQSSQSPQSSQKGGMVPGLLTAVETALVPLGLYLTQKALQSRRSSGSRSLGNSFDFRSASRRTRRRR